MSLPVTQIGVAADEPALIAAIQTLANTKGWTTYGPLLTTPADSVWFVSSGEDGCSRIVGGLVKGSTRIMRAMTAADIDTFGFISANVGGYLHNDSAALGTPIQAFTADTTTVWATRDIASSYTYLVAVSLDSIAVLVTYISSGIKAQGFIYIGKTEPCFGRLFQAQAKAKIASVGAGSNANQRLITMDRNITSMLKDPATYTVEPATYAQRLMFQAVAAGAPDSPDFSQVERIKIVSGTVLTSGGVTTIEIDVTTGVKLAAVARRYSANRGAGDIVRVFAEPSMAICGGTTNVVVGPFSGSNGAIAPWDAYGGQGADLFCHLSNQWNLRESAGDPSSISTRTVPFRIYVVHNVINTGKQPQTDNQGSKNVGALINAMIVANAGQADHAFLRVDGRFEERWRIIDHTALALPSAFNGNDGVWAVGPGW